MSDPNLHPLYVEESDNLPTRPDWGVEAWSRESPLLQAEPDDEWMINPKTYLDM